MSEWQSIETAPKDGTDILAFFPHESKHGVENWAAPCIAKVYWVENYKFVLSDVSGYEYDTELDHRSGPTHWMPLPEPPHQR